MPYRRALNSGAAMLALTFGVPFLAPRLDGLRPLVDRFGCPSCDPAAVSDRFFGELLGRLARGRASESIGSHA